MSLVGGKVVRNLLNKSEEIKNLYHGSVDNFSGIMENGSISVHDLNDKNFPYAQDIIVHDTSVISEINKYIVR